MSTDRAEKVSFFQLFLGWWCSWASEKQVRAELFLSHSTSLRASEGRLHLAEEVDLKGFVFAEAKEHVWSPSGRSSKDISLTYLAQERPRAPTKPPTTAIIAVV